MSPDERDTLQEEIAGLREDLGETVEALVNKTDVKGKLHDKVEGRKEQLRHTEQQARAKASDLVRRALERPAVTAAVAVCAVMLFGVLRRR